MSASVSLAMQFAGQGRLEVPPGDQDGARFEGRFVSWGMNRADGPLFGEDVSLFDAEQVAAVGRGPQSAHLVAMRSGFALEAFEEPFANRGPGTFVERFAVGGTVIAAR